MNHLAMVFWINSTRNRCDVISSLNTQILISQPFKNKLFRNNGLGTQNRSVYQCFLLFIEAVKIKGIFEITSKIQAFTIISPFVYGCFWRHPCFTRQCHWMYLVSNKMTCPEPSRILLVRMHWIEHQSSWP